MWSIGFGDHRRCAPAGRISWSPVTIDVGTEGDTERATNATLTATQNSGYAKCRLRFPGLDGHPARSSRLRLGLAIGGRVLVITNHAALSTE